MIRGGINAEYIVNKTIVSARFFRMRLDHSCIRVFYFAITTITPFCLKF